MVRLERRLTLKTLDTITTGEMAEAKRAGFSDLQLAGLWGLPTGDGEDRARARRLDLGVAPVYHRVDTCAAEFEAFTPICIPPTRASARPSQPAGRRSSSWVEGPTALVRGIEFDYCCCHASFALREMGLETIMVNCNPETVSTDYDTSDRLYFEPLTVEDVRNIIDVETAGHPGSLLGVIVQFGGQPRSTLRPPFIAPACRSWAPRRTRWIWPRTASVSAPSSPV